MSSSSMSFTSFAKRTLGQPFYFCKVETTLRYSNIARNPGRPFLGCPKYNTERITIKEIKNHPWFLKNLPRELTESTQAIYYQRDNPSFSLQSVDEIMKIVAEARNPLPSSKHIRGFSWGAEDEEEEGNEDIDAEVEEEEGEEDEYDKRVKEVHASGECQIS